MIDEESMLRNVLVGVCWAATIIVAMARERTRRKKKRTSDVAAAIVGDLIVDVNVSGIRGDLPRWGEDVACESVSRCVGGSACNAARHLGRMLKSEIKPLFVSVVGGDAEEYVLQTLEREDSVDVSLVRVMPSIKQSTCVVLSGQKDRAMVTSYASVLRVNTKLLEAAYARLRSADLVLFGGFFNCRGLHDTSFVRFLSRLRRESDATIALDPQYDSCRTWNANGILSSVLEMCDVFLPNEVEACSVAHVKAPEDALSALVARFPQLLVVITLGENGVLAGKGTRRWKAPSFPVMSFVDATGAGDAFNAGFLSHYIVSGGSDVPSSLRRGLAAGGNQRITIRRMCDSDWSRRNCLIPKTLCVLIIISLYVGCRLPDDARQLLVSHIPTT